MNQRRRTAFDEIVESQNRTHGRRRATKRPEKKARKILPLLLVVVVVGALIGGGFAGYQWITNNFSFQAEPQDYEGPGEGEVVVTVEEGDTGGDIASTLVQHDVILNSGPFITAFQSNPDAAGIQPGSYRLMKKMPAADALEMLLDPANDAGLYVVIPEGLRMTQFFPILSDATGIPVEDFEVAAANYTELGIPENPAGTAEGYFHPARYEIPSGADAKSILTMMWERQKQELESQGVPQDEWHRVLTLASIAEKEARTDEDFGRVIRTMLNRLEGVGEAGGYPMPLQLDSTVSYVSGAERVSTTPEERAVESPYNTYVNPGLPIGPIGNPGSATIAAAMNPPEGEWLYWVTVNTDTGETKFSTTLEEHDRYVAEWREWARQR